MYGLFSSKRERRLWLWTLAIVAAIYSTLGLAGTWVDQLRDGALLSAIFAFGALLVLVVIVTQGLKVRPGGVEIALALGIVSAGMLALVRLGIPAAERTHLIEYSLVAVFIYQALLERARHARRVRAPAASAVIATALLGWLDEGLQALLDNRVYDVRDVGFNALAGLLAVAAVFLLAWARRRLRKNT